MKEEKLFDMVKNIDDDLICEMLDYSPETDDSVCEGVLYSVPEGAKRRRFWRYPVTAAALLLVTAAVLFIMSFNGVIPDNTDVKTESEQTESTYSTGNTEAPADTQASEATSEDTAKANEGTTKAEFLFTQDGLNMQITANKAAIAFLRGDKEELSQYLADTSYDALSDNSRNIFNRLQYMVLKLYDPTAAIESDGVYSMVYQILINGSEMITYLDLGLKKTDDGWKVEYIYLQG